MGLVKTAIEPPDGAADGAACELAARASCSWRELHANNDAALVGLAEQLLAQPEEAAAAIELLLAAISINNGLA